MKTLIVIPAHNEQATISSVIREIRSSGVGADVLVVNDGSDDRTAAEAIAERVRVVSHPVNLGIGAAVQTGLRYAAEHKYNFAVQVDADGQHPISQIRSILEPLEANRADVVIGSRFIEMRGFQSSLGRRLGIRILSRTIWLFTGIVITDSTSGFRALNGRAIEAAAREYPDTYPEPESIVYFSSCGLRVIELPVIMRQRQGGLSSIRKISGIYYMVKVSLGILFTFLRLNGRRPPWKM